MTAEAMDAAAVAVPSAAPPHPLREFWGYFSANHGAVHLRHFIVTRIACWAEGVWRSLRYNHVVHGKWFGRGHRRVRYNSRVHRCRNP